MTRILRGFLLVQDVDCLKQDFQDFGIFGILLMSAQSSKLGFMRL